LIIIISLRGRTLTEEEGVLRDYLEERGLKMTRSRSLVLRAFLRLERHVTAEELFKAARRLDPSVGQATVFRTMKLLVGSGLARETVSDSGARHYEHSFRHEHHDHLVCLGCGKVVEFSDPGIEQAQLSVYSAYGFEPGPHRLELSGLCPSCRQGRG
jgi:Fur family transcriptional regulator, ferric uptake regulator